MEGEKKLRKKGFKKIKVWGNPLQNKDQKKKSACKKKEGGGVSSGAGESFKVEKKGEDEWFRV